MTENYPSPPARPPSPPARPRVISIAAGALFASAVVLLVVWIAWPEQVVSNGGQVFFIMLWTLLAYVTFRGAGWVRYAIVAILIVTLWGFANAVSPLESVAGLAPWEVLCRVLQAVALAILCLPQAHRWFRAVAALDKDG
ncbi:MAG: hypothetical protein OXP28_00140 [Gammaproteobacteria bacterium]|nr:hypothetical protein [Gammaproteobacteria bacterium]